MNVVGGGWSVVNERMKNQKDSFNTYNCIARKKSQESYHEG